MRRVPIYFKKIKTWLAGNIRGGNNPSGYRTEYLIVLEERNQWSKTITCSREQLVELRNDIDSILSSNTTGEVLNVSDEKGEILDKHYKEDVICKTCDYKMTSHCVACIFELDSPLERKLFIELNKNGVSFTPQYALDKNGQRIYIERKENSKPPNVLTIVDFFIEKRNTRLCIYTDGHTYHERTEDQAMRDKSIDRKLQDLGFICLRYTGKEINENMPRVITEIQSWLNKANYN